MADRVPGRAFDLGIDTASDQASLALLDGDGMVVATRAWLVESTVSRELLGEVDGLLGEAGVTIEEVARIAVNVGPGHYGALRAGIATAQGLALALDVPLAGIGRLAADASRVAVPSAEGSPTVVVVHDAGRGVAWAAYKIAAAGDVPRELVAPSITPHAEAMRDAPRPAAWTGEITDALLAARDAEGRSSDTVAIPPDEAEPRAVALVRIARATDAFGDPGNVDAVYLRPPPITPPRPTQEQHP